MILTETETETAQASLSSDHNHHFVVGEFCDRRVEACVLTDISLLVVYNVAATVA